MASPDTFLDFLYTAPIAQAVVAFVVLFTFYYFLQNHGVPPGPRGLPIIGYWPFLRSENGHLLLQELKDKYGEIFSLNVTGQLYICLTSLKAMKEAHISKAECFGDRFSGYSVLTVIFEGAVAIASGEDWKVQRKFFQQKLKEYGMLAIKEDFSGAVYDTLKDTVEDIRAMEGKPFAVTELLTVKCSHIVRRILFNDQGITEEELKELNHEYGQVLLSLTYKNMLLSGNIAKYLVFPFMPSFWAFIRSHNRMQNILRNVINRHKENFDETQVMDIIDSFYKEKKDRERKADPTAEYFTDKALLSNVYEFVTDGVLTVSYFIDLFLAKLIEFPDEQQKIYKELLNVLGPDRQPSLEDRSNLPYTNAFIYEVIRRSSDSFPAFPSQKCTKETTLRGYRIPKGAVTVLVNYCANNDPNVFVDPASFNPSRFIAEGEIKRTELPTMFGIGRRACMGEPFAMIQAFLFVATIVKNFHLKKPDGVDNSSNIMLTGDVKICAHPRVQETGDKVK